MPRLDMLRRKDTPTRPSPPLAAQIATSSDRNAPEIRPQPETQHTPVPNMARGPDALFRQET